MIRNLILTITLVFVSLGIGATNVSGKDWFSEHVAPVLQSRCLSCHHDGEAKGDFSLSDSSGLLDSGYVDTDDVDASYLLELVTPHDGKAEMPKDAKPLTTDEITTLRKWIASGANWPDGKQLEPLVVTDRDWWSLQPITASPTERPVSQRPVEEEVRRGGVSEHPVDTLVDAKLFEKGLAPVGDTDPISFIRRITYDLTGLPPTRAEVETFITDVSGTNSQSTVDSVKRISLSTPEVHKAIERHVDRLLESPAFGEKWAQHWLDVARYAETHGYDKDKPRTNAWPYRDYVIRSLNDDKAYSRFVQEQIAGDVLFPGDPDGVLGLGFLAAGPWDFIGHWEVGEAKLDGRIAKHLDRDEMVSAVFNVFMSTTVQCAQCHHHKFDPIRMEDYYRLHSVFAAVDRADRVYKGLSEEQQQRKATVLAEMNHLKSEQESLTTRLKQDVAAKASGIDQRIAELTEKYGVKTERKPQYGYHSQVTHNRNEEKWVQLDLGETLEIEQVRIMPAYDDFNGIGAGFGFPVRYRVEVAHDAGFGEGTRLLFDATGEDQPNPGTQTIVVSGDGEPFRYLRVTATKLSERKNDFILALGEIEVVREDNADNDEEDNDERQTTVSAKDSIEQGVRWGRANLIDGIYYRELTNDAALSELHELQAARAVIEKAMRSADTDKRLAEIEEQLKSLGDEMKSFPAGEMVYAAATRFKGGGRFTATEGKPRPIHLLNRGDLRSPADRMVPGVPPLWENTPEVFAISDSKTSTATTWNEAEARVELAHYLTRDDNPLLWRSIVNRLWLWTFGSPLVGSPNDFGRGGMTPTHPELLDNLAARLRDDPNQSLKSIVRLLFTSRAYRRSSHIDPAMAKLDASNAYLWRAKRRRLTAEEFRDSLLSASGLLDRKMGGPSFHDFVIEKPQHSPHYEYHLHDPADPASHRRSVYRMIVRSQPQPLLTTLDCADPSISIPQRDESTTALQALAGWNNRLVEFASAELGTRLEESSDSLEEQVDLACQLVLSRSASPLEKSVLKQHLIDHGPANLARVLFNMNAFLYLE